MKKLAEATWKKETARITVFASIVDGLKWENCLIWTRINRRLRIEKVTRGK